MDTSWIELQNDHPAYINGVQQFLKLAMENLVEGKTRCPCRKCMVRKWLPMDEVEHHLYFKGFYKSYKNWIYHGKGDLLPRMLGHDMRSTSQGYLSNQQDDMRGLLSAVFGPNISHPTCQPENEFPTESDDEGHEFRDTTMGSEGQETDERSYANTDAENAKYQKLLESADEELYEGCASFSKLSFILHLFHLKCMNHWSAKSFNMLLKLLGDAFPQVTDFPSSYYEGKKMINDLGLGYEKIHACPNDCILYWADHSDKDYCPNCGVSRWKIRIGKEGDSMDEVVKKGEPSKVLRYFPLIPRLKRIYMSKKTAKDMRWHAEDRVKDGKLRHPADGLAWKEFDDRYPEFASEPRNVRLGLATDGFNPYRLMSSTYSTWPVVLIPYNLPPWLVMKPSSFILSMIIPGKSGPGNNIDVFLQPVLHEFKLLWDGVDVFDAHARDWFKMRVALMWTINDFPALSMLAGWSTKGYNACPSCTNSTHSYRFAGRICYPGCRRWLDDDEPDRSRGDLFDGKEEHRHPPIPASGTEILRQQEGINYVYGKQMNASRGKRTKRDAGTSSQKGDGCDEDEIDEDVPLWTKKSIFFELPYWEYNRLRHNLDVMHIEKNVCDILLGTLLDMDKSRDDVEVRKALEDLGIKPHLWLQGSYMPPAPYNMSSVEKERFLTVLQKIKFPDGYGSNISRCVNMKKRKLQNLKSHDNHILMQDVLPVALRASNATRVIDLLSDLSSFFKDLCSTTLDLDELDGVQWSLILTLCEMEKEFPPTFSTIMVHLLVHLVEEAKLGGPVQHRWMYLIERYLSHLKSFVSNRSRPEGSIAEGFILEETITFCSRYLEGVETIFNRSKRNDDSRDTKSIYMYNSGGRVVGMTETVRLDEKSLKQAHRYVLLHSNEINELKDEFIHQKQLQNLRVRANESVQNEWIMNEFSAWLLNQISNIDGDTEEGKLRKSLAGGLNSYVKRFKVFMINGYKFHTMDRERFRKTQNSGVMVEADGQEYFGRITDIYELDYYGAYKVVVFRCEWVDLNRGLRINGDGRACVNFSKLMHTGQLLKDDPFIFSSQAKQVFYVEDELQKGWYHVIKTKPRDLFDLGDVLP